MEELKAALKQKIIDTLNLVDITPDDIADDAQLVGGDFGIDSIDVLELVVMIEEDYGVSIDSKELGAQVFRSIDALAQFVTEHATK